MTATARTHIATMCRGAARQSLAIVVRMDTVCDLFENQRSNKADMDDLIRVAARTFSEQQPRPLELRIHAVLCVGDFPGILALRGREALLLAARFL